MPSVSWVSCLAASVVARMHLALPRLQQARMQACGHWPGVHGLMAQTLMPPHLLMWMFAGYSRLFGRAMMGRADEDGGCWQS